MAIYLKVNGQVVKRAISIRQPYAELIMQGLKDEEYRSIPTRIRERIYIYASNTLEASEDYSGELGVAMTKLPRGVLVGTVEVVGCEGSSEEGYAWILERPIRLKELVKPVRKPQPVWFNPF